MAQILSLKADAATSTERSDTRQLGQDNDRKGFADAFEQHLKPSANQAESQQNESRRSQRSSDTNSDVKASDPSEGRERDGKKLPDADSKAEKAAASDDQASTEKTDSASSADKSEQKSADEQAEQPAQTLLAAFERIPANPNGQAVNPVSAGGSEVLKTPVDQTLSQQIAKLTAHLDQLKPEQPKPALSEVLAKAESKSASTGASIRADILAALNGRSGNSGESTGSEIKIDKLLAKAAENGEVSQKQLTEILRQMQPQSNQQTAASERGGPGALMNSSAIAAASSASQPASLNSAASASPQMQSLDVQADMKNPNWSRVVSSRVVWMAQQGMQQAELRLNPPTLGPVDVRLSVQNDQTTVNFIANNATTREALEQALPRLRESFQENGLQLAHADVGEQSGSDQEAAGDSEFAQKGSAQVQVAVPDDDNPDVAENGTTAVTDGLSLYA